VFNVQIDLKVQIEGCPESGLVAVDFRRTAGLPETPNNWIELKREFTHEPICRQYQQYLTSAADLVLMQDSNKSYHYTTAEAARPLVAKAVHFEFCGSPDIKRSGLPVVSAATVAEFLRAEEGTPALVDALIAFDRTNGAAVRAAVVEAKAAKAAEAEAKKAAEAKQKAELEAKRQAEAEQRAKAETELREWAQANGSELLRLRLVEGFDWVPLALREWDAALLDGETEASDPEDYSSEAVEDRKQPSLAEIQRLQEVRAKFPAAICSLVRVRYTPYEDEDGDEDHYEDEKPAPIYRTEVRVEVVCCGHWEREFFLPA
jgi:hypothetical protein